MRLFLALTLPAATRLAMWETAAQLRETAPAEIGWRPAEKLHLPLKSLGDQPDDVPGRLAAALGPALAAHRPADLELRGVGAFPTMRRPRVVWIGVRPEPRLELLHHDV